MTARLLGAVPACLLLLGVGGEMMDDRPVNDGGDIVNSQQNRKTLLYYLNNRKRREQNSEQRLKKQSVKPGTSARKKNQPSEKRERKGGGEKRSRMAGSGFFLSSQGDGRGNPHRTGLCCVAAIHTKNTPRFAAPPLFPPSSIIHTNTPLLPPPATTTTTTTTQHKGGLLATPHHILHPSFIPPSSLQRPLLATRSMTPLPRYAFSLRVGRVLGGLLLHAAAVLGAVRAVCFADV